ncbi:uncharacterized protein PV07_08680 [Cladophialophora immunda]|uniref:Uncharacterized protein n=1 Tax=Cladophialophora immunda TaxID=569365 RepID=A0A0D2CPQ2_9EURO|nr:uncharacterized protein PV07_08680 [Cladophialophora immunda]KIW25514.1 hypothetical protein PV07_08680 [Cladophialophora immunda]
MKYADDAEREKAKYAFDSIWTRYQHARTNSEGGTVWTEAQCTGATGYIGGDFLYLAYPKHPEWEFSRLVRNTTKGAKVAPTFPKVRLVYVDLDAVSLIEDEAAQADVVYHFANADHAPSATAISKMLRTDHMGGQGRNKEEG